MVEENPTKKCPNCQTDIPEKATKCPNCHSDLRNWFRRHPVLTVIMVLVAFSFVVGVISDLGGAREQAKEKMATEQQNQNATWQKVKSWQGTGIKKTEVFIITGDQWKVNWKNQGGDFGGGILSIYVYRTGSDLPEELLANTTEIGSDTSYIYKNGTFYLDINAANTTWEVEVEELK